MRLLSLLLFLFPTLSTALPEEGRLHRIAAEFSTAVEYLAIPPWSYDYRDNFRAIPAAGVLEDRRTALERIRHSLDSVDRTALPEHLHTDYDHLLYIVEGQLQRIGLEQRYIAAVRPAVPDNGLAALPDAADWYALYTRYSTTMQYNADELFAFGLSEIAQARAELHALARQAGYGTDSTAWYRFVSDDRCTLRDTHAIIREYRRLQEVVYSNLHTLFAIDSVPPPAIIPIPSAGPATPPAYYDPQNGGVFFFNLYGGRHSSRSMAFLYLHEAVPGHHYHWQREQTLTRPAFARNALYPSFFEGWAAYVETLGDSLGVYNNLYSRLGRWEWDLVRSVRVCIDVGIHVRGWTHEQAVAFWQQHIPHNDDIADREVGRCTRWPGQVLSYKTGEAAFEHMREHMRAATGANFDIRQFHEFALGGGQLPLAVLQARLDGILLSDLPSGGTHR